MILLSPFFLAPDFVFGLFYDSLFRINALINPTDFANSYSSSFSRVSAINFYLFEYWPENYKTLAGLFEMVLITCKVIMAKK